jgi:AcrR family transcriptional regulator
MAVGVTTRRGAESEQAILDAARDILAHAGVEALSMRSVADRVGMSATAIYRYFKNKDALVGRVVQVGFDRFGAYLTDAGESHPRGSVERLAALGEAYIRFALENEAYFKLLFSLQHPHPHSIDDLPHGAGHGLLRSAVLEAIEAGSIRRYDPDVVVMYLWSVAHGLLTLSMSCRIDECPEFEHGAVQYGPIELFEQFRPLVRDGIAAVRADRDEHGGSA